MSIPFFQVTVAQKCDSWLVHLSGEMDFAASLQLTPKIAELTESDARELLFDLSDVTLIDSEGIKTLLIALDAMRKKSGQARIVGCSKAVKRILDLVGITDLINNGTAIDQ